MPVGGDRHADPGAADQHAEARLAGLDGRAGEVREIRIVHAVGAVGAEIQHGKAFGLKHAPKDGLQGETGVIGGDCGGAFGDGHGAML